LKPKETYLSVMEQFNGLDVLEQHLPEGHLMDEEVFGVKFISIVDDPAIQAGFTALSAQEQVSTSGIVQLSEVDEERQIVTGPAMIPDLPIYRPADSSHPSGPYYMQYSKRTVEAIAHRFMKQSRGHFIDVQHNLKKLEGAYLVESFIYDKKRGVLPAKSDRAHKDGTWFVSVKIDNESAWKALVKGGLVTGFSIYGMFSDLPGSGISKQSASAVKVQEVRKLSV